MMMMMTMMTMIMMTMIMMMMIMMMLRDYNLSVPLFGGGGSLSRCATKGKRSTAATLTDNCSGAGWIARPENS